MPRPDLKSWSGGGGGSEHPVIEWGTVLMKEWVLAHMALSGWCLGACLRKAGMTPQRAISLPAPHFSSELSFCSCQVYTFLRDLPLTPTAPYTCTTSSWFPFLHPRTCIHFPPCVTKLIWGQGAVSHMSFFPGISYFLQNSKPLCSSPARHCSN